MTENVYTSLRVLVVEDDQLIRKIIRELLSRLGIKCVTEATDGVSGLLEVLRVRPDIVFCDVHMKPLGGIEFLKQLRNVKQHELADTAVIMLTSDCTADTVSEVKDLGANGYLVKPVTPNQIKARIDAVLAASQNKGE